MKKWILISIGSTCGLITGIICIFVPFENRQSVIMIPVQWVSSMMQRIFMPNSDPMAAFFFEIPVFILLLAFIGGVVGYIFGLLLKLNKKKPNKVP